MACARDWQMSAIHSKADLSCVGVRARGNEPGFSPSGPVPVGNLRPEILVVQSAQNWHRQRATDGLDSTRDRRVLLQRKVRPSLVVIFLVRIEQMAEMSFAENYNMVKTIPSDRTDETLTISLFPCRLLPSRTLAH